MVLVKVLIRWKKHQAQRPMEKMIKVGDLLFLCSPTNAPMKQASPLDPPQAQAPCSACDLLPNPGTWFCQELRFRMLRCGWAACRQRLGGGALIPGQARAGVGPAWGTLKGVPPWTACLYAPPDSTVWPCSTSCPSVPPSDFCLGLVNRRTHRGLRRRQEGGPFPASLPAWTQRLPDCLFECHPFWVLLHHPLVLSGLAVVPTPTGTPCP